ncbi:MAG TPA: CpsD/CapB family tyrosine-protein kinase [Steroidobacteraceae bacterium]|jgi:protein-tyrosine kinase|nr:CpsD/CapB family tyrosine-protein kinase [Steroidobacteraceae bacterium]
MSVEATDDEFVNLGRRQREALIAMGKLTIEGAVRIEEAVRTMGVGYGDAALRLGLITPGDLEDATAVARHQSRKASDSIIEGVLHKMSSKRNMPVKYVGIAKAGTSLILLREPDNAYSEQIRALRTELLLLNSASRGGRSLVILSPCRGEGRTQLCAELAVSFAQLGQPTLLVDADLRRPRLHSLFEPEGRYDGLGQELASGGTPEFLTAEKLPQLSVLLAGPSVPNPLELLTNGHFQGHMADWRKKYSMIIIDTPPITEFADGLAIASFADQVVIVGRSGSTPHKNMKEMLRRMGDTQARIVGAVYNRF